MINTIYVWFFVLGTALGSFYNVLIDRLPEGRDIVLERSSCSECGTKLKWYDLIPIVSFVLVKGKCRYCGTKLSPWYLVSEILMGGLTTFAFVLFTKDCNVAVLFGNIYLWSLLFIVGIMDWKSGYIMDIFSALIGIGGIAFGLIYHRKIWDILLGGLVGAAIFGFVYLISRLILKREGLGFGDVLLLGALGFWFSWKEIIVLAFLSAYVGIVFIIIKLIKDKKLSKKTEIPFGPSMCIAAFVMSFYGSKIMSFLSRILLLG